MEIDIVIYGDSHYDLKTEGIDRTDDIDNSHDQIIDYVQDLVDENRDVLVLNMGDVFHGTRPRPEVMARVISTFNRLENMGVPTHIIAGNHDVIDQQGRTSSLEPLRSINWQYIHIIHDIIKFEYKGVTIVTLPHISKARAIEQGFKGVQDYIDIKSMRIEEVLPEDKPVIVIGHHNIAGAKTGTEGFMIKGAQEEFPKVLKESKKVNYIFNGHIHKPQLIPNEGGAPIIITGDISTNDFGERLDQKQFFHLTLEVEI
jgi:DNA repair exonuclease SbcCD nuclease subunit